MLGPPPGASRCPLPSLSHSSTAQCKYGLHSKPSDHPCPGGHSFWAQDLLPSVAGSSVHCPAGLLLCPSRLPLALRQAGRLHWLPCSSSEPRRPKGTPVSSSQRTSFCMKGWSSPGACLSAWRALCLRTRGRCGTPDTSVLRLELCAGPRAPGKRLPPTSGEAHGLSVP